MFMYTYIHTLLLPSWRPNFCCSLSAPPISFLTLWKISNDHTVLLVLHVSATLQSNISLKIIYSLSIHVFTSYSLFTLFNLDLILSTPLKIPLSWNTSFFSFLDTRFPWGFSYLFGYSFSVFSQWLLLSYSLSEYWSPPRIHPVLFHLHLPSLPKWFHLVPQFYMMPTYLYLYLWC